MNDDPTTATPPADAPKSSDPSAPPDEIRIGVSTCLLGEKVRYDGGHKRDPFLTRTLGDYVTFVPVCPEVELGLGIPRPTLRLVGRGSDVRMVFTDSEQDITDKMERWSKRRLTGLLKEDLCGYILKSGSPSCGMERVKVYSKGMPSKQGVGVYAKALMARLPLLPVEEEGRLHDPNLRENFVERVFAYRRLRTLFQSRWRRGDVVSFHEREKLLLLSHEPEAYRELGRMVGEIKDWPRDAFVEHYQSRYMTAMAKRATRGRHTNVLQHMVGYLHDLDGPQRAELAEIITDYRAGLVPLIVPITLIKHHVRRLGVEYLSQQHYLHPHPKELMLRNHV